MPRQLTITDLSNNGDGTYNIAFGGSPNAFDGRQISELFDRTVIDPSQVFDNCRLAALLANVAQIATAEYLAAVNKNGAGMQLIKGKVHLAKKPELVDADSGLYHVGIATKAGGAEVVGFECTAQDLLTEKSGVDALESVIRNIGSFLRVTGATTLDATAIAAVKATKFWA